MHRVTFLTIFLLLGSCPSEYGQTKRTAVPMGDAVAKALEKGAITGKGAQPFHIRVSISEPENLQSPYQGALEEWWVSPDQWRREISAKGGLRQTIVVAGGKKTEHDEGDYLPLWLNKFVMALFNPIPNADAWTSRGIMIEQITMSNGDKSDACARSQSKIGTGDRATDAFSNVCFDGEGRLKFFGSPGYDMEFRDYRSFGKKQIARRLVNDPEPGTELVGAVTMLEDESKVRSTSDIFIPLQTDEDRFRTIQISPAQMEQLSAGNAPILWPPIHSGNVHGRLAVYVSVDTDGNVREAWPLNSDNAGLDDSVRDQVRQWKMKPAKDEIGKRVQVNGGLGFVFDTRIEDALPQLSDPEVRQLATKMVEPSWPTGSVHPGQTIEVEVSVDEHGKLTGTGFTKVPGALQGAVNDALRQWAFNPLIQNGKPQYFRGTIIFTAR